mgnify:CR=1 FL=1
MAQPPNSKKPLTVNLSKDTLDKITPALQSMRDSLKNQTRLLNDTFNLQKTTLDDKLRADQLGQSALDTSSSGSSGGTGSTSGGITGGGGGGGVGGILSGMMGGLGGMGAGLGMGGGALMAGLGVLAGGGGYLLSQLQDLDGKKVRSNISELLNIKDDFDGVGDFFLTGGAFLATLTGMGVGLGVFAIGLATGKDPVKAAKSAGGTILGKAFGTALFGPIGGFFGGTIGSIIGGRVICNELMRQGIMTRKQVILDYKFTRDYLTPTHVNGYHVWAVWMVKQMRKGKFVKFWKHVAGHRANEIAYIYGERDNPDYLGKVYRRLLEPLCWSIGLFCNQSDWSVLYNKKEI